MLARALRVEPTLRTPAFRLTPDDRLEVNPLVVLQLRFPSLCVALAALCLSTAARAAEPDAKPLRALLVLGRYGEVQHQPDGELPMVSQETLAEIIGATRSRVNLFMNKFRKLGFIEYHNRRITINKLLLTSVLAE